MNADAGTVLAIIGGLIAAASLIPWLKASDRRAEQAKALATAQQQDLLISALSQERDDLKAKLADLDRRVDRLEIENRKMTQILEGAIRHD